MLKFTLEFIAITTFLLTVIYVPLMFAEAGVRCSTDSDCAARYPELPAW